MSQQINLFNPVFLKQHKMFSLLTMLQALGLIVIGSLLFYGYALYQVKRLNEQSIESAQHYLAEQARLDHFKAGFSPDQENKLLQNEVQRLEKRAAEQRKLVDTMKSGAIGNTTGYSEYMRAFARQALPGLWLTGFRIIGDGAQINLSGGVLDPELLPTYVRRLGAERVMQGKTFSNLQMQQPKVDDAGKNKVMPRYVQFQLHSMPESEAKP